MNVWAVVDGGLRLQLPTLDLFSTTVSSVAFASEDRLVILASDFGSLEFWNLSTGTLEGYTRISGELVAAAPTGLVGTRQNGGPVKLWTTPQLHFIRDVGEGFGPFAFGPDGSWLVIGGFASGPRVGAALHDAATGVELRFFGMSDLVTALAISTDGSLLALGTLTGIIRLYAVTDGTVVATWSAHLGQIESIAFAAVGTLASAGQDGKIRLWAPDGVLLLTYDEEVGRPGGRAPVITYSPDGRYIAYQRTDPAVVLANNPFAMWPDADSRKRTR